MFVMKLIPLISLKKVDTKTWSNLHLFTQIGISSHKNKNTAYTPQN